MTDASDYRRLMAICEDCGSVYAAFERPDGEIVPIGSRTGCICGSTEFSEVGPETLPEDEKADDD